MAIARKTAAPIAFALVLIGSETRAQAVNADTLAAARVLYNEAIVALDAKDFATACPKLEQVVRMIPNGLGARLTLAECYEGAGKLASAWSTYAVVEEMATRLGQLQRASAARKQTAALAPKLAKLTISVPDTLRAVAGLEVRRNGDRVEPALWGKAMPVDRGEHTVAATAPGREPWETRIEIPADGAAVTVNIQVLKQLPVAKAPADTALPTTPAAPASPRKKAEIGPWGAQRIAGIAVGGVGLVGIGVGSFFGLRAISKKADSDADGHCHDGNQCDDIGYALREEGYFAGTVSTVLFVVGGAALAGGVTLFLTAPRPVAVTGLEVVLGPQGLALKGRW